MMAALIFWLVELVVARKPLWKKNKSWQVKNLHESTGLQLGQFETERYNWRLWLMTHDSMLRCLFWKGLSDAAMLSVCFQNRLNLWLCCADLTRERNAEAVVETPQQGSLQSPLQTMAGRSRSAAWQSWKLKGLRDTKSDPSARWGTRALTEKPWMVNRMVSCWYFLVRLLVDFRNWEWIRWEQMRTKSKTENCSGLSLLRFRGGWLHYFQLGGVVSDQSSEFIAGQEACPCTGWRCWALMFPLACKWPASVWKSSAGVFMDSSEEYVSGMLLICKGASLLHVNSKTVQSMFVFHVFAISAYDARDPPKWKLPVGWSRLMLMLLLFRKLLDLSILKCVDQCKKVTRGKAQELFNAILFRALSRQVRWQRCVKLLSQLVPVQMFSPAQWIESFSSELDPASFAGESFWNRQPACLNYPFQSKAFARICFYMFLPCSSVWTLATTLPSVWFWAPLPFKQLF